MTSPEILALERERIFNKVWLYVGHESEVEKAGDYRSRNVGGRPIIFMRGSDGKVRAFFNACRHRGATVCRQYEGNTPAFQCLYHAWTYNDRGELINVPDEEAFGPVFDKGRMGLKSPPRMENYRGLYFISFNPDVEDLKSYLAGATEYIDLVMDQAEEGMRIVAGSQRALVKATWKLGVDNSGCARKVIGHRMVVGDDQFQAKLLGRFGFLEAGDATVHGNHLTDATFGQSSQSRLIQAVTLIHAVRYIEVDFRAEQT